MSCRYTLKDFILGFQGLAAALAYMHSKGLVDQDLSPDNVLHRLNSSAWVKADLGNAAWMELDGRPNELDQCM